MPIENRTNESINSTDQLIGSLYLQEALETLDSAFKKIKHCLNQLAEEDLHWRPFEAQNSIQNILLHLSGNLKQWILHGIAGEEDQRNRPQEFSERSQIPKPEICRRFEETVQQAKQAIVNFAPHRLTEPCRIQGFEITRLSAIFDSVSHFVGHTHQIIYITRLRLEDQYQFLWEPQTTEEGASL